MALFDNAEGVFLMVSSGGANCRNDISRIILMVGDTSEFFAMLENVMCCGGNCRIVLVELVLAVG